MPGNSNLALLARDAISLSFKLKILSEHCQHENMNTETRAVADELAQLSHTIKELEDTIDEDPTRYTEAFNEDLKEIMTELTTVFLELQECCAKLDAVNNYVSGVAWFFRKGRVARLVRHLEALRGTLLVMRTVLWHGKEYGTHQ